MWGRGGEILIIWESSKFICEEVLIGSFSITVKSVIEDDKFFWLTSVYVQILALSRVTFGRSY